MVCRQDTPVMGQSPVRVTLEAAEKGICADRMPLGGYPLLSN